jgi:hypothetical protein
VAREIAQAIERTDGSAPRAHGKSVGIAAAPAAAMRIYDRAPFSWVHASTPDRAVSVGPGGQRILRVEVPGDAVIRPRSILVFVDRYMDRGWGTGGIKFDVDWEEPVANGRHCEHDAGTADVYRCRFLLGRTDIGHHLPVV